MGELLELHEPGLNPEKKNHGIILSDEPSIMRQHLRELMDNFFLNSDDTEYNREVFDTYVSLDMFLKEMEA